MDRGVMMWLLIEDTDGEAETAVEEKILGCRREGIGTERLLVRQNSRSPVPPSHCRAALGIGPWLIAESRPCPGWEPRGDARTTANSLGRLFWSAQGRRHQGSTLLSGCRKEPPRAQKGRVVTRVIDRELNLNLGLDSADSGGR